MLRVLRAFLWLRWRTLVNALERTGSRDTLARLSAATEGLGTLLVLVALVPSIGALAGLGLYTGWSLPRHEGRLAVFEGVRFLLGAGCFLALAAPLILPSGERTHAARLILLPISRRVLYLAHALATTAHPLVLLTGALVVSLAIGLAAAGAPTAARWRSSRPCCSWRRCAGCSSRSPPAPSSCCRIAGAASGWPLVCSCSCRSSASDRRSSRGSAAPGARPAPRTRNATRPRGARSIGAPWPCCHRSPMWPRCAAAARHQPAVIPLATLGVAVVVTHLAGFVLFGRLLASAGGGSGSRRTATRSARAWRVPGVPAAVSAVALNQVRLALRTPRGRFTLLSPLVIFVPVAGMLLRSPSGITLGFVGIESGIGVAAVGGFVSLLAILPLCDEPVRRGSQRPDARLPAAARDTRARGRQGPGQRAGDRGPATLCIAASAALFPGGDPALWACVPLALLATYLMTAPAAVALSAIFPRSVDLNSIGHGSNAHGAAGFIGTAVCMGSAASCLVPVTIATRLLHQPRLAPLLLAVWILMGTAFCRLSLGPLSRLVDRRRESFVMLR
jgi:hypothetical protein